MIFGWRCLYIYMIFGWRCPSVRVCARACVCVRVCVCVRACERECVSVCAWVDSPPPGRAAARVGNCQYAAARHMSACVRVRAERENLISRYDETSM